MIFFDRSFIATFSNCNVIPQPLFLVLIVFAVVSSGKLILRFGGLSLPTSTTSLLCQFFNINWLCFDHVRHQLERSNIISAYRLVEYYISLSWKETTYCPKVSYLYLLKSVLLIGWKKYFGHYVVSCLEI